MKKRIVAIAMVLALIGNLIFPVLALAADPVVTITVSAKLIAATNTQANWAIGPVEVDNVVYFSATGAQDDDYSQVENTGNVAIDVELQGTDFEGGAYDWTLAAAPGDQIYSLYANSEAVPGTYDVEVKKAAYNMLVTNLAVDDTYDWSMKFTAPTAFDPADAGANKTATVTLAISEH